MCKYIFCILLFIGVIEGTKAQEKVACAVNDGSGYSQFDIAWDNYVEVNFSDVEVKNVGGTDYLYFTINFKRLGFWYSKNLTNSKAIPSKSADPAIHVLNLYFDFDKNVMATEKTGSLELVSCPSVDIYGDMTALNDKDNLYNMKLEVSTLSAGVFGAVNFALYSADQAEFVTVPDDTYREFLVCRWKLKSGASGKTGIKLRVGKGEATDFYALANNTKDYTPLGICYSGDLNVDVGGTPTAPEITDILASAGSPCSNASQTFTATVTGDYTNIEWQIKDVAGNVLTDAGTITAGADKSTVEVKWAETAGGTYQLCGTPKGSTDGTPYCKNFTVTKAPSVTIDYDQTLTCGGSPLALTATATDGTNLTTALQNIKWTENTGTTAVSTALTYNTNLPTASTVYHFAAETTSGGCPVEASVTLSGTTPPNLAMTAVLASGATITDNTYHEGDIITLSVPNGNYTYAWTVNGTSVSGSSNEYVIDGADLGQYDLSLVVTDNATGCTQTITKTLTKSSADCQMAISIQDHFSGSATVTICSGGVALMDARVTPKCGDMVTSYAWYKKAANNSWAKVDTTTSADVNLNSYSAREAGTYQVRVYTVRGVHKAEITVTAGGTINSAGAVKAWPKVAVQPAHSTLLGASGSGVTNYYWTPENLFASGDNAQQYPTTLAINEEMYFYVYGKHYDACVSLDSTHVILSNKALEVKVSVAGTPLLACDGEKARMWADVTGGSGYYNYVWPSDAYSKGPTDQKEAYIVPRANIQTTYQRVVQVTDQNDPELIGYGMAVVNVSTVKGPELQFDGITSGNLCELDTLWVKNKAGNPTTVEKYNWYIKNNTTGNTVLVESPHNYYPIKDKERGEYTVWVSANAGGTPAVCFSDTANAKTNYKVKGFDLAWQTQPADQYSSGQTLTASAVASNGTGNYTFGWLSPQGGVQTSAAGANPNGYKLEGASAAKYTFRVKATDDGCSKEVKVEVGKVNDEVDAGLKLALDAKDAYYCSGGISVMGATATGGQGPYQFSWYDAANESVLLQGPVTVVPSSNKGVNQYISDAAVSNETKIVVKVTDANGLVQRDTVTLKPTGTSAPEIVAEDDFTIPYNTNTWLSAKITSGNPTAWHWSDASLLTGADTRWPRTKNQTSDITYKVYASQGQCYSNLDSVKVSVYSDHNYKLALTIDAPAQLCDGSNAQLSAQVTPADRTISNWGWNLTGKGAGSGSLSDATAKEPNLSVSASANTELGILLKVKDANGVSASAMETPINVLSTDAPTLSLTGYASGDKLCSGQTLTVSAGSVALASNLCEWFVDGVKQEGVTGTTFTPTVTDQSYGEISVTAVSVSGCPASGAASKTLTINPKPVLAWTAVSADPANPGDVIEATLGLTKETKANYTYTWTHTGSKAGVTYTDQPAGASAVTTASSRADLGSAGASETTAPYYFQVFATDANGCQSETLDTVVTVGDGLFVTVEAKYGAYCQNGAGVMIAKVVAAGINESDLRYQWYQLVGGTGTALTGKTEKELMIASPNTTDEYYVVVTTADGTKTGTTEAHPFKFTAGVNTAPQIAGTDLTIPKGTKTALIVTTSDPVTSWKWSPEEKLATGESTLRSPYTTVLNADQPYQVYGVDAQNCVSNLADVTVHVINVATPPAGEDPDPELFVKVIPAQETICRTNELGLDTKVWSTGGTGTPVYSWIPADNLSDAASARPVFNAGNANLPAATYSYTVKVTKGALIAAARVDIVVKEAVVPILALESNSLCAGGEMKVKQTSVTSSAVQQYIWIVDGAVDAAVTGDTYTWPAVAVPTEKHVKVIAVNNDKCRTNDSISFDGTIQPAAQLGDLVVADSCGMVRIYAGAGTTANYTWNLTEGQALLTKAYGVTHDTLYLKANAAFTNPSITYAVSVEVTPASGGCKQTGTLNGKIYDQPKARILDWIPLGESAGLPYVMVEKGGNASLKIQQGTYKSTANYVWTAAQLKADDIMPVAPTPSSATYKNVNADDSAFLTVTNKEAATCFSTDTFPLYLYPEAPTLKIDTVDGSLVKVALHLESNGGDNFTIWSRKWDPYCLTTRFTGDQVYVKEPTATNIISKLWREPDMDTLEFYYATSGRTIAGRTWDSKTTSDTVGYYKRDVLKNTNASKTSNDLIPVYFNFANMGYSTSGELITALKDDVSALRRFDYTTQGWPATLISFGMVTGSFTIETGTVLQFASKRDFTFMQYGKLPSIYEFTLNKTNTTKGNNNLIFLSPSRLDIAKAKQIIDEVLEMGSVRAFKFDVQGWAAAQYSFGSIFTGDFDIYPLLPLQIELKSSFTGSVNWK